MRLRIASSQALHPSFCPFGAKAQSRRCSSLPHQTHFVGLCWGPRDLFRQKFVCKTLKYTKYSCGFAPFSDEKSLVKLSCRFVRYCHTTKHPHKQVRVQMHHSFLSTARRNCLVLGFWGWSNTSWGLPSSTTMPPSMNTTWSATSRANPIS